MITIRKGIGAIALTVGFIACPAHAQQVQSNAMSFFITSVGTGVGGNLGGLEGADKHCQALAAAVGAGNKTWRAYLSTQGTANQRAVNARDRIGKGPWYNAKGVKIAENLAHLHGDTLELARVGNVISRYSGLTEKGAMVNGYPDTPLQHDMLTGSRPDGTAFPPGVDRTCHDWTSSTDGTAQIGHFDRNGGASISWNSAHETKGCSAEGIRATGGDARYYCFATN